MHDFCHTAMEESDAISVQILPPTTTDIGSQRCRLPPQVINSFNIQHGDLIAVQTKQNEVWLCEGVVDATCAWSRQPPTVPIVSPDQLVRLEIEDDSLTDDQVTEDFVPCLWPIRVQPTSASACFVRTQAPKSSLQLLCGRTVAENSIVYSPDGPMLITSVFPNQGGLSIITPSTRLVLLEGVAEGAASIGSAAAGPSPSTTEPLLMHGLELALNEMQRSLLLPLQRPDSSQHLNVALPCGLLLVGSHASGVHHLPQMLAQIAHSFTASRDVCSVRVDIQELQPTDSSAATSLAASVAALRQAASANSDTSSCSLTLLVLPDAHRHTKARTASNQASAAASSALLAQMDALHEASSLSPRHGVVLVGITDKPETMDAAFRRPGRFEREITLGALTSAQRTALLLAMLAPGSERTSSSKTIRDFAAGLNGYQRQDLVMLARAAIAKALKEGAAPSSMGAVPVQLSHLSFAAKCFPPSSVDAYRSSPRSLHWTSIGGYADVKQQLERALVWPLRHPDAFSRLGIAPPSGVLLFGPPGCAKTSLVHAAANESKVSFISLSGADVTSAYVGESERMLRKVFKLARASRPSLVFIDEAEALVGSRGGGGLSAGILTTLLTEMDGVQDCSGVVVVASTNLPHMLDAALLRPGRLESRVLVGPPDQAARQAIFELYTSGKGMALHKDVDIPSLVRCTEWYTGAEIEGVCREAGMAAVRRSVNTPQATPTPNSTTHLSVSQADFTAALGRVKAICSQITGDGRNAMQDSLQQLSRFASQAGAGVEAMVQ